jgi:hypothetical protein
MLEERRRDKPLLGEQKRQQACMDRGTCKRRNKEQRINYRESIWSNTEGARTCKQHST